jgi:beta-N-acetylhexosaminidase
MSLVNPWGLVQAASPRQETTSMQQAQQLLERLTPEERVGQIFLATFDGMDAEPGSQIYDLIVSQHIGGVILLAENDNFTSEP